MTKKEITIQLDSGLETRPVALLVQVASQYDSDIYIESDNRNIKMSLSPRTVLMKPER